MAMRSEGGDVAAVGINNHVDVERELWSHGVRDKSVDGAVDGGANPQDECHPESGCTGCPADNQDVALTDDSDAVDPKWRRFSEWMHCVCLVTFDLELGQVMEVNNNVIKASFLFVLTQFIHTLPNCLRCCS